MNSRHGSSFELAHRIVISSNRKRICTCIDHRCDLNELSEGEYLKRKNAYDAFKRQKVKSV